MFGMEGYSLYGKKVYIENIVKEECRKQQELKHYNYILSDVRSMLNKFIEEKKQSLEKEFNIHSYLKADELFEDVMNIWKDALLFCSDIVCKQSKKIYGRTDAKDWLQVWYDCIDMKEIATMQYVYHVQDMIEQIARGVDEQKALNDFKKTGHGRLLGGGFGIGGALKGMAFAGVANLALDGMYSAVNAMKNYSLTKNMESKVNRFLFSQDTKDDIISCITFDMGYFRDIIIEFLRAESDKVNISLQFKNDCLKYKNMYQKFVKKSDATDEEKKDLISYILSAYPTFEDIYVYALEQFGDENDELEKIANEYSVNIEEIKEKKLSSFAAKIDKGLYGKPYEESMKKIGQFLGINNTSSINFYIYKREQERLKKEKEKELEYSQQMSRINNECLVGSGDLFSRNKQINSIAKSEYQKILDVCKNNNDNNIVNIRKKINCLDVTLFDKKIFIEQCDKIENNINILTEKRNKELKEAEPKNSTFVEIRSLEKEKSYKNDKASEYWHKYNKTAKIAKTMDRIAMYTCISFIIFLIAFFITHSVICKIIFISSIITSIISFYFDCKMDNKCKGIRTEIQGEIEKIDERLSFLNNLVNSKRSECDEIRKKYETEIMSRINLKPKFILVTEDIIKFRKKCWIRPKEINNNILCFEKGPFKDLEFDKYKIVLFIYEKEQFYPVNKISKKGDELQISSNIFSEYDNDDISNDYHYLHFHGYHYMLFQVDFDSNNKKNGMLEKNDFVFSYEKNNWMVQMDFIHTTNETKKSTDTYCIFDNNDNFCSFRGINFSSRMEDVINAYGTTPMKTVDYLNDPFYIIENKNKGHYAAIIKDAVYYLIYAMDEYSISFYFDGSGKLLIIGYCSFAFRYNNYDIVHSPLSLK